MSRDKGTLGLSANLEPQVAAPLDARRKVALKADLLLAATWTANDGGIYAHDGMYTVVFGDTPANNGMWILSGTDYTDIGNWVHLSTSGTAVLSRFDTVANAEANTFQTGEICFIEETLGSYYHTPSGSAYTRDGDRYLNTGAAGDTRLVRYTSEYSGDITKDPTGFYDSENVSVSYDSTARTVTLSGTVSAFWRARQITALYSGWTSAAHDTGDGVYYLYYNGTAFIWSTELWEYDYLHIARVIVSNSGTVKFCIRECHGFTYPPTHYNLHQNIGTSRLESSGLLTSYVLDSVTAIDRRPDVNLCNLFDEDLETVLPALTSKVSYSWWYRTGINTVNIDNDHDEIINLLVNQPYWNENIGGSWQQTLFSNNFYGKIFVLAAPVTSDVASQKYRYIFIQPQEEHLSYNGISGVNTLNLDLGGLVDELLEFVFIAEIIIQYIAGNWSLKEVNPIEGTRVSQVTVSGSATTSHNNLPGLQGGSSVDGEFFHLTEDELVEATQYATNAQPGLSTSAHVTQQETNTDDIAILLGGISHGETHVGTDPLPFTAPGFLARSAAGAGGASELSVAEAATLLGVDLLASMLYVQSRLQDLITNGNGLLGNNYNFPGFDFDTADLHSAGGSFLDERISSPFHFSTEYIPADIGKRYRYIMWGKSGDADGGNYNASANQLVGLVSYDVDKNLIQSQHSTKETGSTDTTLAVDLNPGDPTITLTDATGWSNGAGGSKAIAWYGYTNNGGYTYPDYTYTRNVSGENLWPSGGISGNVITLNVPWAGPALSAGDSVRNATYSGYKYMFNITGIPQEWTRYETYIDAPSGSGNNVLEEFFEGTAFLRMVFRLNRFISTQNNIRFDDFSITSISSDNIEPATSTLQGVVSLEDQVMGAGKKTFVDEVTIRGTTSDGTAYVQKLDNSSDESLSSMKNDGSYFTSGSRQKGSISLTTNYAVSNSDPSIIYVFPSVSLDTVGLPVFPLENDIRTFIVTETGNNTFFLNGGAKTVNGSSTPYVFVGPRAETFRYTSANGWWGSTFANIYPSFYVHRNGVNQTVTSGVHTLIDWTTKDPGYTDSGLDLSTDRFTPQVEGVYTFTLYIFCIGATESVASIYKNGSVKLRDIRDSDSAGLTISFYMNGSDDYVEAFARNTGGTELLGHAFSTAFSGIRTN